VTLTDIAIFVAFLTTVIISVGSLLSILFMLAALIAWLWHRRPRRLIDRLGWKLTYPIFLVAGIIGGAALGILYGVFDAHDRWKRGAAVLS
jgi:ABC-type xylose transport system permease subunit